VATALTRPLTLRITRRYRAARPLQQRPTAAQAVQPAGDSRAHHLYRVARCIRGAPPLPAGFYCGHHPKSPWRCPGCRRCGCGSAGSRARRQPQFATAHTRAVSVDRRAPSGRAALTLARPRLDFGLVTTAMDVGARRRMCVEFDSRCADARAPISGMRVCCGARRLPSRPSLTGWTGFPARRKHVAGPDDESARWSRSTD
jgi:hypothetical protein